MLFPIRVARNRTRTNPKSKDSTVSTVFIYTKQENLIKPKGKIICTNRKNHSNQTKLIKPDDEK